MSRRPWYKRFPSDFIAGTIGLTAEEKGVYSTILDLLYDRDRPIADDPRELGRICGCSTLRFKQVRDKLASIGKITLKDGFISNDRFERQRPEEQEEHENLGKNGKKGAEKTNNSSKKTAEKNDGFSPDQSKNNDLAENRPRSQNSAVHIPEARSQKEPLFGLQEQSSESARPDLFSGAPPPDPLGPELSDEEEFWSLADQAQKSGIARALMGKLAKLSGDYGVALPALKGAMRQKNPAAYIGKVISNLREDLGPNVRRFKPKFNEPEFVQLSRADGYPVDRLPDGRWKIGEREIFDERGMLVGW